MALAALLLCACHVYREPCTAGSSAGPEDMGVTVRWCWAVDDEADAGACG